MTKGEMETMIQVYKDQVDALKESLKIEREDKIRLQDQVDRLQEGLMAVRAPEAYRDQRVDRLGLEDPYGPSAEEVERHKTARDIADRYIRSLEEPMFRNVEEMVEGLESTILKSSDTTPPSVHGNSES